MDDNGALTDKQLRVIPFLLEAPSIGEGCKQARVSKATVYGWLKQEAFKAELKRQREEIIKAGIDRLKAGLNKAIDSLLELVGSTNEGVRRMACKDILEFAFKGIEQDLEKRLEAAERALGIKSAI
ncbi:MAG: hypothetical protein HYY45_06815 [Deltaproteobacteria bacterium]|nr:hypothetical protein [Deltaproteobacteria bacterium]